MTKLGVMMVVLLVGAPAIAREPDDRPAPIGAESAPGPLVGAIEITNERDRAVRIFVDGRFAIELRARTTDVLEQVPNGVRLVSYAGAGRERWQTDRVEVREDRRAALRIAPLRGQVAVMNRSDDDLRVMLGDVDLGVVKPGRELLSPPLPEGVYRLSSVPVGWTRAKPHAQEVTLIAGETVQAEVRSMAATLVVSNPFARAVSVWVDGRRVTRLDRMESERIGRLQPGRTLVELRDDSRGARSEDARVLASDTLELVPGRESYFAPQPLRHGALEVTNPTRRPVRITLPNESFRLAPGASRFVDDLPVGPLTIQLTTDDGRIVRHRTEIIGGETHAFVVPR